MPRDTTRRTFLAGTAAAGALAVAGCMGSTAEAYELWILDQSQDTIYTYEPDGDGFTETDEIDVNALEGVPDEDVYPHMISYSSDYEYALVSCTTGARTLVFRTEDHELVGNVETGAGSHMANFSPDDEYIHVDAIGEESVVRVDADLEAETFEIVDEIHLPDDDVVQAAGVESAAPICHQFDPEGRSLHTLGPGYGDAGLVIIDHDDFAVTEAFPQEDVPTNCGTMPHYDGDDFYLTAGLPSDPDQGVEGVGDIYVFDTAADEVSEVISAQGNDAHGFWFTVDGEELWVLNRETNDGVILDPETNEVIEEIDAYGPAQSETPEERDAPDIMWASPDGEYMFVSLRGPVPLTGDPHAATGVTPGVAVIEVESHETVDVIEPDPIDDYDDAEIQAAQNNDPDAPRIPDYHGIGVRPIDDFDTEIETSPPF